MRDQRFIVNHQIELLSWPAHSPDLSPMENMWSMVVQQLTQIIPPAATPDQIWQRVESSWSAVPHEYIQSLFESMTRRVAAVISNNGGYSGYRFLQEPHFTEVYTFNHYILGQHVIYKINFAVISLVFLGVAFTVASSVFKVPRGQTVKQQYYIEVLRKFRERERKIKQDLYSKQHVDFAQREHLGAHCALCKTVIRVQTL
ncbi:transposable element Tcb1 transposase [Trichonephila clavipes]|uniref:Transposable element Tcb1 transposase n=1 Tax=Trichonephila clavipes TaxID=2585209 RepID=A0A8X6RYK9_TRICX|nr:transposable element Tcb1 transposase [Trichonephila clavipes]